MPQKLPGGVNCRGSLVTACLVQSSSWYKGCQESATVVWGSSYPSVSCCACAFVARSARSEMRAGRGQHRNVPKCPQRGPSPAHGTETELSDNGRLHKWWPWFSLSVLRPVELLNGYPPWQCFNIYRPPNRATRTLRSSFHGPKRKLAALSIEKRFL